MPRYPINNTPFDIFIKQNTRIVMNISKIKQQQAMPYAPQVISRKELNAAKEKQSSDTYDAAAPASWQKDILLNALDRLENNIQTDDSHPLDRAGNMPIESFDEALIELSFIKTPMFRAQASGAQANINPEDVAQLFTDSSL